LRFLYPPYVEDADISIGSWPEIRIEDKEKNDRNDALA
jgi:hypothetical protein